MLSAGLEAPEVEARHRRADAASISGERAR